MADTEFIDYENRELTRLQQTFTPQEQQQYGEEVRYIQYLLNVLKQQQQKPQTKKQKEKEKKTKEQISRKLGQLINNFTLKKNTDITHTELTPEEILDAKLTRVSNKYYKLGGVDSDNYLAQEGIDGWKIDENLSNDKGIVAFNEKTGKAKVAFRGTDRGNLGDLEADARIYMGNEQNHDHFKTAREQTRLAIEKYGKSNVSTTGYSLGGNKSWLMGNEFGINSTGYNSFIGKSIVKRPDIYTEGVKHKIIRTQDDLPSIQTAYLDGKNNTEVKVVETRGGNMNALNPYKAHADSNFISNEGRSGNMNNEGALAEKMSNLANHAVKHGELRTLDDMIRINKKYKVKNSQTGEEAFLTEDEWEQRGDRIGQQLDEASRINQLTRGDRMEARERARKQRQTEDFEMRDSGELIPLDEIPLINRRDPRYKAQKKSTYQSELDRQTHELPKQHAPKKPIPTDLAEELGDNLPSHNDKGLPIDDYDPSLLDDSKSKRKSFEDKAKLEQFNRDKAELDDLNKQLGEFNEEDFNRTSKEALETFKGTNQEARIKAETMKIRRDRARQQDLIEKTKTPPDISTTPTQDAELSDVLEFARGLSPPKTRTRTKTLSSKTRAEMKGLRNKTNPPLERPNSKSRGLQQQTERLEQEIMEDTRPQAVQQGQPQDQSFTEWANDNNVEPSNHKKTLWEKSGGKLTEAEKQGYSPTEEQTFGDTDDINNFVEDDREGRQKTLEEHSQAQSQMETDLNNLDTANIRAGGKSYGMEIARGIHPTNLALGYLTGKAADSIMSNYVDKILPSQPEALRTTETGVIAGGLTSTILGTALLPEAIAGGAGYLTQKYATEGIYKGLKALGASENVSEGVADTGGGAAAGGVAGFLGAFAAGAATGAEEGGLAGLGVASLETGAIGAGIGGLIGLGSYAIGKIFG